MDYKTIKNKIETLPDFIYSKRFDNSIEKFLERYPNGDAPTRVIAQCLLISEEEVNEIYNNVISKLKKSFGVDRLDE